MEQLLGMTDENRRDWGRKGGTSKQIEREREREREAVVV